jgi:predicted glycoside hydrolase/deacetylase ChbG (UPF0249 family)
MLNPALRRLGFSDKDRVVILHADDVGMCQATLPALDDLVQAGLLSSASTMVPCPWFPQVAAFCQTHPGVDMGVHLTTTCEYTGYRWGPLTTRDPASGLMEGDGCFHRTAAAAGESGRPAAVRQEMQAQLDRARAAGVDVTHVDSHMLTAWHPKALPAYVELARGARLPLFLLRPVPEVWQRLSHDGWTLAGEETAALGLRIGSELEAEGWPLVDHVFMMPLDRPDDRVALAKQVLDALPPGITHFVLHPAVDSPELRAITPDWPSRVADYRAFTSSEWRSHVRHSGLQVMGYRALRDLLRAGEGKAGG